MKILKTLGKIIIGFGAALVLLFAMGYVLTFGEHTVPKTIAQDPSLPQLTIAGITYHGETYGDPANPVVIELHGGPGGDYRSNLPLSALADAYYVVFFDQRGAGLSPRVDPGEITLESAIADLDAVVEHYGQGGKVNLVGHSWGAMLASAYVGRYPHKVNHLVLAEPGFLNTEFAEEWAAGTQMRMSLPMLTYFLKTKFESLHVSGPDDQAADDYFGHTWNLYQGDDHPPAAYRCPGDKPKESETWRYGAAAANAIFQEALDADGNFDLDLAAGVDQFENPVLFMTGACQTLIGEDYQRRQMQLFPNAELAVIPDAGHEMFLENPEASVEVVRAYLSTPIEE
jgi:proline iminopeptidase